jgi:hypothetical protein
MTLTDIIQKARFLSGYRMHFPEKFALIGIDQSDSEAESAEYPVGWSAQAMA